MPTTLQDIETEVRDYIEEILKKKRPTQTDWIPEQIMAEHGEIRGSDKDWYVTAAHQHVRNTVMRVLREFKEHASTPEQLRLPGYEHLQRGYLIERNGKSYVIAIDELTNEELLSKAVAYRSMGAGCYKHADEIERFCKERRKAR